MSGRTQFDSEKLISVTCAMCLRYVQGRNLLLHSKALYSLLGTLSAIGGSERSLGIRRINFLFPCFSKAEAMEVMVSIAESLIENPTLSSPICAHYFYSAEKTTLAQLGKVTFQFTTNSGLAFLSLKAVKLHSRPESFFPVEKLLFNNTHLVENHPKVDKYEQKRLCKKHGKRLVSRLLKSFEPYVITPAPPSTLI